MSNTQAWRVVVTGKTLDVALAMLKQECELQIWDDIHKPIPKDLLLEWLKDSHGIYNSGHVRIDSGLLQSAPLLKVIAQPSVGYDNVDISACTEQKIPFSNTPGVLTETTADLAFGLLLTAARKITIGWDQVRGGRWTNSFEIPFGIDLYGKTMGIVGMGQIGAAVARRARAFGMNVIYYNRTQRPDDDSIQAAYVPFETLLSQADCIIVLTPLTQETRGLFNEKAFSRMKPTCYFVNASRGPVVDAQALYQALSSGKISFAALDVTDPEPIPANHPLVSLPNILITPHIGSATIETRTRMAELAVKNLLAGLAEKPLPTCVNHTVNYR
mgnify:CR=1 FL=1